MALGGCGQRPQRPNHPMVHVKMRTAGRQAACHPWTASSSCQAAEAYARALPARFEREAARLAALTQWPIAEIRARMEANGQSFTAPLPIRDQEPWWEKLWKKTEFEDTRPRWSKRG